MSKNFLRDETGLEMSEYAIAVALITALIVLAFTTLGGAIVDRIDNVTAAVNG